MIIESTYPVKHFLAWLNSKKLTDLACKIVLLPQHDTVQGANSDMGFAVYHWGENIIYVAGLPLFEDIPEEELTYEERECIVLENIAHEYVHHLQFVENREPDDDEAENRAVELYEEYLVFRAKTKLHKTTLTPPEYLINLAKQENLNLTKVLTDALKEKLGIKEEYNEKRNS